MAVVVVVVGVVVFVDVVGVVDINIVMCEHFFETEKKENKLFLCLFFGSVFGFVYFVFVFLCLYF